PRVSHHAAPAQEVVYGHVGERCRRSLQRRSGGGGAVGGQPGEAVEQQVERARGTTPRWKGPNGAEYLLNGLPPVREMPGEDPRAPCDQVRLARELQVEGLE